MLTMPMIMTMTSQNNADDIHNEIDMGNDNINESDSDYDNDSAKNNNNNHIASESH